MASNIPLHFYLVSFPGQGHVNPLLRLAKCLASDGHIVTFSTTEFSGALIRAANYITNKPTLVGDGTISFEFFDDGFVEDDPRRGQLEVYVSQLELIGKEILPRFLEKHEIEGRPVSCLINNPFIPWVSDVAESLGILSAVLWVQSCACFSAYYHFYHESVPFPTKTQPDADVQLPCMPLLKYDEIPSLLLPTTPYPYKVLKDAILGQYKNLSKPFCILVDTFQELEHEVIEYMSKFCPVRPVGPLFRNPKAVNSSIRADFFKTEDDCIEWLNSKYPSSVVYISFGSVVFLGQKQIDEIAYGLLRSESDFLWVMKPTIKGLGMEPECLPDGFLEEAGEKGKVVQWSPQEQVLAHPSIACFVTHCGWNSTMEALCNGVPVVAFPQWGDQVTNAKYLVDVFEVGIRMSRGEVENKIVIRDEVEKCFREITRGKRAEEIKENAMKWKRAAAKPAEEGGSSEHNLQAFVNEVHLGAAFKSKSK